MQHDTRKSMLIVGRWDLDDSVHDSRILLVIGKVGSEFYTGIAIMMQECAWLTAKMRSRYSMDR